ncbi:hypothetical protein N0V82_005047 [Gnomoniopsis sp. IMI 355080]|nr:hypothetical protein N0V82_005047 [Gnomoniopsis sp. IMI 355080]
MGRNKNKKKSKDVQATKAQSPMQDIARTSTKTSETSQPGSYAEAAAKPPTEEEKVTNTSTTAPISIGNEPSSSLVISKDPETTPARPNSFEDGAVHMGSPPIPKTKPGTSSDDHLDDSSDSEFSLLKKAEISEAGSPGYLVKEPSEEDVSRLGEGPSTETHKPIVRTEQFSDPTIEARTSQAGTEFNTKASQDSSRISRELPVRKAKDTLVRSISKAEWDKTFDSGSDEQDDAAASAECGAGDGATGTVGIHPAVTENRRLVQVIDENEVALYEGRVFLQDCSDKLEADWEKEKERLKAEIDRINKNHSPGASYGGTSAGPSDSPNNSGIGGPSPPDDDLENATLKNKVQELQGQLKDLRNELKEAQDELNALLIYERRKEDPRKSRKERIAACKTENEKLEKYGGTLDRESSLYQTMKKFAEYHDNSGPQPTAGDYAQVRVFQSCIVERRRIMAQAKNHPDPKGFMTPYLDKWDSMALAGGCTFFPTKKEPPNLPNLPSKFIVGFR